MEEFQLAEIPSRAGMYRFASRMRTLESAHRIESALTARDEAGALIAKPTTRRSPIKPSRPDITGDRAKPRSSSGPQPAQLPKPAINSAAAQKTVTSPPPARSSRRRSA